ADATGRTDVPGVWAAGNVTELSAQVAPAAAAGLGAGAQINADLVAEETRQAVAARREALSREGGGRRQNRRAEDADGPRGGDRGRGGHRRALGRALPRPPPRARRRGA